jgi:hypothetical protein
MFQLPQRKGKQNNALPARRSKDAGMNSIFTIEKKPFIP